MCRTVHNVQRQHGAAQHIAVLAATVLEMPAHKAAHVLDGILLALSELAIFLHSLRGTNRGADAIAEILPADFTILPSLVHAAVAVSDFEFTHVSVPPDNPL